VSFLGSVRPRAWVLLGFGVVAGAAVLAVVLLYRSYFGFGGPSWSEESVAGYRAEMIEFRSEALAIIEERSTVIDVSDDGLSPFDPELNGACGSTADHADMRMGVEVYFAGDVDIDALSESLVAIWSGDGFEIQRTLLSQDGSPASPSVTVLKRNDVTLLVDIEQDSLEFGLNTDCRHSPGWQDLQQ